MFEIMFNSGKPSPVIWSTSDAYFEAPTPNDFGAVSIKVPDGITQLCGVCIGAGGYSSGGLSWRNNIPVTPGETLTMIINNTHSALLRDDTLLIGAGSGAGNAKGGKNYNAINDGGGNAGANPHGRGGAGGYTGNGGDGHAFTGGPGPGNPGSGGGGGGAAILYINGSLQSTEAGGVGMYGRGADGGATSSAGLPGSGGSGKRYGRWGDGMGVVRIVWGNYSFPTNAPKP